MSLVFRLTQFFGHAWLYSITCFVNVFSESKNIEYVKVKHFNWERVSMEHLKRKAKEEYESIVKVNIIKCL